MQIFPLLNSGAVMQYPAPLTSGQGAQVIRYLDGSDQRYVTQGKALRRWEIRLNLLTETEIHQIEEFFASQSGNYGSFAFPDPFTGATVPNCRLGAPEITTEYMAPGVCATSLWVIETNG
jgi:hypothetical protein